MRIRIRREIVTAAHYLLIGVIAGVAVIRWRSWLALEGPSQLLLWLAVFVALTVIRLLIVLVISLARNDQWEKISRRNW